MLKVAIPSQGGHLAGAGYQAAGTVRSHRRWRRACRHAGAVLLVELAGRLGLPSALDRWTVRRQPRRQRAGKVVTDLAAMLADGGNCLSDLAGLRDQPGLFGPVASTPTAWRVLERLARVVSEAWPGCGWPVRRHGDGRARRAPGWTGCL